MYKHFQTQVSIPLLLIFLFDAAGEMVVSLSPPFLLSAAFMVLVGNGFSVRVCYHSSVFFCLISFFLREIRGRSFVPLCTRGALRSVIQNRFGSFQGGVSRFSLLLLWWCNKMTREFIFLRRKDQIRFAGCMTGKKCIVCKHNCPKFSPSAFSSKRRLTVSWVSPAYSDILSRFLSKCWDKQCPSPNFVYCTY